MATKGKLEWDLTKSAQDFLEGGQFYDKGLGVIPAEDFALPTSGASNEVGFSYTQSSAEPLLSVNKKLRNYSPFTMRVMPPLLYLENPDLLTGTEKGNVNMGLYDSAISNNSNFNNFINVVSSYNQPNGSGLAFSQANNDNFASSEATSLGARSTTKLSEDMQSDQMFESAITDMQSAEEIAIQLDTILKAPPITFYINPVSFAITYTKKHQFTERTRFGFIYQAWGEDQPKISISGRIGSFVSGQGNSRVAVPTGHQFGSKLDSASFQQLMALLTLYKNNGYIYDVLGKSNAHHMVGCIAIEYDGYTYFGHIESFEWGYEENNVAGGINYSFQFTVSRMYDNKDNSLLTLQPLKSPVPIPGMTTLNDGTPNLNSTTVDNRFIDRNVEVQNFAQTQANSSPAQVLNDNRTTDQIESGDIQNEQENSMEAAIEEAVEGLGRNIPFYNTSGGRG